MTCVCIHFFVCWYILKYSLSLSLFLAVAQFCDLASKASEVLYVTRDLYRVDFRGLEEALQNVGSIVSTYI